MVLSASFTIPEFMSLAVYESFVAWIDLLVAVHLSYGITSCPSIIFLTHSFYFSSTNLLIFTMFSILCTMGFPCFDNGIYYGPISCFSLVDFLVQLGV